MTAFRHSSREDAPGRNRGTGERFRPRSTALSRLLLVLVVVVVAGYAAGLALGNRGAPSIGRGVVVVDTNLAYEGAAAAGTGIVLTPSGEILTNNHVIRGATAIKVVVPGTGRSYTARVVGYDMAADIAVLQAKGASNLKTVAIGDSSKLAVGQRVSFLGNAGGTGSLTRGTGTITGLGKSITANDEQGSEQLSGLIESNVDLQPGDSGGPLLNGAGKVVGVDAAGSSQGAGFEIDSASDSYAIPINRAVTLARQIEAGISSAAVHVGGTAFLGIEVQSGGQAPASFGFGIGVGTTTSSNVIAGVVAGSPAASAGLAVGDVITALDGKAISSPSQITAALLSRAPGTKVSVSYEDQSGASHRAIVTLGSGPAQ